MKIKHSRVIIFSFALFLVASAILVFAENSGAAFEYQPMEGIPGFEDETMAKGKPDLKVWIESTYKFFMWVVGICALFMITIGGFTYMTSAGNTSTAATGKKMITDSIIGLILALVAFLLFNVINPEITNVNLQITSVSTTAPAGSASGTPATSAGGGSDTGTKTATPPETTIGSTCAYSNTNNVINFSTTASASLPGACAAFGSGFQSAATLTGIDIKLLKAIAATESSCSKNAGSSSSCGLMQLRPETAGQSCQWLKDNPDQSILIAAQYIKANQGTHGGNIEKIAAGYNAGYGTGNNSDGTKPAFAPSSDCPGSFAYQCCINPGGLQETQDYIFKVEKYYNGQS